MTKKEKDSILEELKTWVREELKSEIKEAIAEELSTEQICATEDIKSEIKDYIKEHLHISVDGYYEPYSGQRDHYHRVDAIFSD